MHELDDVPDLEERLRLALIATDMPTMKQLIDDRFVFTGPDGLTLDKTQNLLRFETGSVQISALSYEQASFHRIDGLVVATIRAKIAASLSGHLVHADVAYTHVWSKRSGEWRLIVEHASTVGH